MEIKETILALIASSKLNQAAARAVGLDIGTLRIFDVPKSAAESVGAMLDTRYYSDEMKRFYEIYVVAGVSLHIARADVSQEATNG